MGYAQARGVEARKTTANAHLGKAAGVKLERVAGEQPAKARPSKFWG